MAGLDRSAWVIHRIESGFDAIRSGQGTMTPELLDVTLQGVSAIRESIEQGIESDTLVPIGERAERASAAVRESGGNTAQALPLETFSLPANQPWLYRVEKVVSSALSTGEIKALPIFTDLTEVGTLLTISPPLEQLTRAHEEEVLQLFVASHMPPEDFECAVFDPFQLLRGPEQPRPTEASVPVATIHSRRILLVEDDRTTRELLQRYLSDSALITETECSSAASTLVTTAADAGEPFDIVLLDFMLTDGDGLTLLRRIREEEERRDVAPFHRMLIIMTTSKEDAPTIISCFREGADGYLMKPVVKHDVVELIRRLRPPDGMADRAR